MRSVYLVLLFTALASALEWKDLRVKWSALDIFRLNSYFQLPRTKTDAVAGDWSIVDGINSHNVSVYCYKEDPRVCILLDTYGHICGFQVGVLVSDLADKGLPYNMSAHDMYRKKTFLGEEVWTTTVYTVDPEIIDAGGRSDMEELTGTEGVWIETTDGYMAIPRNVTVLTETTKFVKQNCIGSMGTHYYYNMSESMECEDFLPYFLLYDDDELLGVGFQTFGSTTTKSRSWYESVPWFAIKPTIPTAPTCLVDWAWNYKVISFHVYFVEKPWNISC